MNLHDANSPNDGVFMKSRIGLSRVDVLASYGALPCDVEELLSYNCNYFELEGALNHRFPLADEAFIAAWEIYAAAVHRSGSLATIYQWFPHLQFPIQPGLERIPQYAAAVRRGEFTYPAGASSGVSLDAPHLGRVILHSTAAGRIPVIIAGSRSDFITLIRAFTRKGEPAPIPDSMGAIIISGYNNFHRVHLLRDAYLGNGNPGWAWTEKFQAIKQQKELYQDRFVILSPGPYSGVPAASLGLDEARWEAISLEIRLEHECTHYFTRRVFGSMKNSLLDELIADYCGLDKAIGKYSANWVLSFLGLESPEYRLGGRLENYRGTPSLSSNAFEILGRLVRGAVANLKLLNLGTAEWKTNDLYQAASILAIGYFTLEDLAAPQAAENLIQRFQACMLSLLKNCQPAMSDRSPS